MPFVLEGRTQKPSQSEMIFFVCNWTRAGGVVSFVRGGRIHSVAEGANIAIWEVESDSIGFLPCVGRSILTQTFIESVLSLTQSVTRSGFTGLVLLAMEFMV